MRSALVYFFQDIKESVYKVYTACRFLLSDALYYTKQFFVKEEKYIILEPKIFPLAQPKKNRKKASKKKKAKK